MDRPCVPLAIKRREGAGKGAVRSGFGEGMRAGMAGQGFSRRGAAKLLLSGVILSIAAACAPVYNNHGYIPSEQELALLEVGVDTRETVAAPDALRENPAESSTMQAGTIQIVSAAGAGISAVSALSGTAQIVAMAFCGVVVLAALWIMRERLRKWAEGDR